MRVWSHVLVLDLGMVSVTELGSKGWETMVEMGSWVDSMGWVTSLIWLRLVMHGDRSVSWYV